MEEKDKNIVEQPTVEQQPLDYVAIAKGISEVQDMIEGISKKENLFKHKIYDENVDKIINIAKNSKPYNKSCKIMDAYGNTLNSSGEADVVQRFTNYGFSNDTLNWPLWLALYNDSWVFRRAIDKPAEDEINSGIVIYGASDFSDVYKWLDKLKTELIKLIKWGAIFGGSLAVMLFDGIKDEDLKMPLTKDKIKGKKTLKLYTVDRWYGVAPSVETVTNIKNIDYGKPVYYQITFADGHTAQVHHSWILRYEHRDAPPLVKNGWLQGWGYAEGAHILNELSRDDELKAAITSLINKCNIEIIKMAGMKGLFMSNDQQSAALIRKRLEMVNWGRTYNSLTFLDKDDDYQHYDYALTGLSDLLENNMYLVSSALEMPGVLFESMKGGISQDDNSLEKYSNTIHTRAETYVRPVYAKLLQVLFIMNDVSEKKVEFEFKHIDQANRNTKKMDGLEKFGNVLGKFIDLGVISKYQAAVSLMSFAKEDSIKFVFTDENLKKLKVEEEMAILETYKMAGKGETENSEMLKSEFGGGGTDIDSPTSSEIPDKIENIVEEGSDVKEAETRQG